MLLQHRYQIAVSQKNPEIYFSLTLTVCVLAVQYLNGFAKKTETQALSYSSAVCRVSSHPHGPRCLTSMSIFQATGKREGVGGGIFLPFRSNI